MKLKEMKLSDLGEKKYDVLFPIGATEQHGPFAPYGTDTYITEYLVDKIDAAYTNFVILPILEFSRSGEHRGYPGTLYLSEETLHAVMSDIHTSVLPWAKSLCFISFHANDLYINNFIKSTISDIPLHHIEICVDEDELELEKILGGLCDDHAGNSEISNMLVINEQLVTIPASDFPKRILDNAFGTDNLIEFSETGIVDNNPVWNVNKKVGQEILDVYERRVLLQVEKII